MEEMASRVSGLGSQVPGFKVSIFKVSIFKVSSFKGSGLKVSSFEFRVSGFGFEVDPIRQAY
ncbi:MAG: hypothetical protein DMG81_02310 [Acidobacteria bacterium]|nr:MAG: hypothetical protein DMG81_02310 [Acidobacteriota bacterium]